MVHDDPEGLAQGRSQVGVRVGRTFPPLPSAQVGPDHVGLHRSGPEQRDLDDQILEPLGLQLLQQFALAGTLDLEAPEGVGGADEFEGRRVVVGDGLEVDLAILGARDLVEAVSDRREHAHPQHIELEVAQQFHVVLVGLDHAVAPRGTLERDP